MQDCMSGAKLLLRAADLPMSISSFLDRTIHHDQELNCIGCGKRSPRVRNVTLT